MFSSSRPLRIGYYVNNGLLTTVPAVQRAVLQAKAHMEAKGHTVSTRVLNVSGPCAVRCVLTAIYSSLRCGTMAAMSAQSTQGNDENRAHRGGARFAQSDVLLLSEHASGQ